MSYKKKYRVWVKQIWVQAIDITASSPEIAVRRVLDGHGEEYTGDSGFMYQEDLDSDSWDVEDLEKT